MKQKLLLLATIFLISNIGFSQNSKPYQYVNPLPNSFSVNIETNIIIRPGKNINSSSLNNSSIEVTGSKSGLHSGEIILSDDNKTIVFNPYEIFANNEIVKVSIKKGIKTVSNNDVPEYSFNFQTVIAGVVQDYNSVYDDLKINGDNPNYSALKNNNVNDYLPPPPITINSVNNPSPGYIFMATWDRNVPNHIYGNYLFILDNVGNIVDSIRVNGAPFDFQVQPNGLLSYALGDFTSNIPGVGEQLRHYVMDSTFAIVDSFQMKNGYETDFHEFHLLPNGHALLMSFHKVPFDMSKVVSGGKPDATLIVDIIQEQDRNKNVVFEWRDIDYFSFTDSTDADLTQSRVHPRTLNGFYLDNDGNILASFRDLSTIAKISRSTGEILWKMGRYGDFTFFNEHPENAPYFFARQHNVKRLPNGNISILDNGEFHNPPYTRAVEYNVDEINKTATLVSEFRYPNGNIFAATAGNAQKLTNGGWFVGYGVNHPFNSPVKRNIVESHPDGTVAFELTLPNNVLAYRASKFPWKELVKRPSVFNDNNMFPGNTITFTSSTDTTGVKIHYLQLAGAPYKFVIVRRIPYGPIQPIFTGEVPIIYPVSIRYGFDQSDRGGINSQQAEFHIDLSRYPEILDTANVSMYIRDSVKNAFVKLPTTHVNNELIATSTIFGEIVFGVDDVYNTANTPILFEPENTTQVSYQDTLSLKWSGKGLYDSFNLQFSTDSTFASTEIDTTLNSSFVEVKNLSNNTKYFWRVRALLNSTPGSWSDIWNFEATIVTGIENNKTLPKDFTLSQNYPNPFNPSTVISYSIPSVGIRQQPDDLSVLIRVFDVLGREVATLVNKVQTAGNYKVTFNATHLSSGIYFYRMEAGDFVQTKKLVLLK